MITVPTLSEIYSAMRADAQDLMEADAPIPRLSVLNVLIVVMAGAVKLLYGHLYNTGMWSLPDRARGSFLTRLLSIYQVTISQGTASQGAVVFSGNEGSVIPTGTILAQVDGTTYETVANGLITAEGISEEVIIQSVDTGNQTNYTGSELTLTSPPTGITGTAELVIDCTGGSNADTEEDSRTKLLQRLRTPLTAGLTSDYERICLAVTGVGRVWVRGGDWWTGPNTVAVTLATRENEPVSAQTLTDVQSTMYDDANVQPGITVGVYNLTVDPVTVHVGIVPDTTVLRQNVEITLKTLFRDGISPRETLKISDIRSAIKSAGVDDYDIEKLVIGGIDYDPVNIEASPSGNKKFSYGGATFV